MPQAEPRVSIITRTRDRHALLRRALESVLGQELGEWELIIVNDGGDAAALDALLEPWRDRFAGRLRVIHNEHSLGMQAATNRGLEEASGEFVAVHDDDDAWAPQFLSACVGYLDAQGPRSRYQGVITHTVRVWEDVDSQGRIVEHRREPYLPIREVQLFRTPYENPFPPIAFLYRRAVHETLGGFDSRFDVAGDLDFNVRFLLQHEIGVIPRPLAHYHWRRNSAQEGLQNSVTAQADVHGRRLNEWLNHYLRTYASQDPAQLGLAVNVGHYAAAIQNRADRALERIEDLKHFVDSLVRGLQGSLMGSGEMGGRLGDLKEHLDSNTRALIGDALPRIESLQEELTGLATTVSGIGGTLDGNSRSMQERLADLKVHLNSFTGVLEELLVRQRAAPGEAQQIATEALAPLKASLNSLREGLQQSSAEASGRLYDLEEHLDNCARALTGDALPRIESLQAELTGVAATVSGIGGALDGNSRSMQERLADVKGHLNSFTGMLEELLIRQRAAPGEAQQIATEALAPLKASVDHLGDGLLQSSMEANDRLRDLKEHLSSETQAIVGDVLPRMTGIKEHLDSFTGVLEELLMRQRAMDAAYQANAAESRSEMAAMREDLSAVRRKVDEHLRTIRIGRLHISWKQRRSDAG